MNKDSISQLIDEKLTEIISASDDEILLNILSENPEAAHLFQVKSIFILFPTQLWKLPLMNITFPSGGELLMASGF